jgi:hypothetical protein
MLYQLCPTYDDLKFSMEKGPSFKPVLIKNKRNQWILIFEAKWYHDSGASYSLESDSIKDFMIKWTEEELIKWKDCRRIAWDMWQFKYKRDAEKFITLFHLIWQH